MTDLNPGAILRQILPFPKFMERALGLHEAAEIYGALGARESDAPFTERLLEHLDISYRVSERDLERIPREGPALVVVNHPFGILDGAVVASILLRVRPDVKILANHALQAVPELRELLIPIDPIGTASALTNARGFKRALEFLSGGGLVLVFPAGEVAHFRWKKRAIAEPEWSPAIARMIALAGRRVRDLSLVPAFVAGANSWLFQALGSAHPRFRTALLVRELLNKRGRDVEVRIGHAIPAGKLISIPTDLERTQYLRWRSSLLAHRSSFKPRTALPLRRQWRHTAPAPIAAPTPGERLASEVGALDALLKSGEFEVYLAPADRIPAVLEEIGRLRETAFRAAGEGTGKPSDLDRFDAHYLHLFVWNTERREVAGAYRLGPADQLRRRFGVRGLYTATLFEYDDEFLDRLGPALELGRSFVALEYQRAFAPLLLLWKGIGKYVAQNPRYKVLFGPVSISNQYQSISRQLMVSFLERHASLDEWAALVCSRNPFRAPTPGVAGCAHAGFDIEDLSAVVADIEPAQPGVPVLLRQYLKLGGKLLGFNVDPEFADTLDGLILVDLTQTDTKLLARYLGKSEAVSFLDFHGGAYGPRQTSLNTQLGAADRRSGDSAANAVL